MTSTDDPLTVLNKLKEKFVGSFSDLPKETKEEIKKEFTALKPRCPNCLSQDSRFRYINNMNNSKSIQPRFTCHFCRKDFTLGGKRYIKYSKMAAQTMNNFPNESFIQAPKEILGFQNTQSLELQGDNIGFNAVNGESFHGEAGYNLFAPCFDNGICMPNLVWAPMAHTNYPQSSFQGGHVDDGYGNHLKSFESNVAVKGVSYGNGMAEQNWNDLYGSQRWNNCNNVGTQKSSMLKECMHDDLRCCTCLSPSTLEMPMDDNSLDQLVSQFLEENPNFPF